MGWGEGGREGKERGEGEVVARVWHIKCRDEHWTITTGGGGPRRQRRSTLLRNLSLFENNRLLIDLIRGKAEFN